MRFACRIDHYLGKETVQNIMAFRFANGIFEPIWNRRYIDHVQITVAETVGVEHRGAYYEEAGAMRDMVQTHLFQLQALTAMKPPISFEANAVRDERVKVLKAIHPLSAEGVASDLVRAQYDANADGSSRAYRDEPEVAPDTRTETLVALKLLVDNWRWADVPFYLRTGKRLAARVTEIVVQFWIRLSNGGRRPATGFTPTHREAGDRPRPTRCSRETDVNGGGRLSDVSPGARRFVAARSRRMIV